MSKSKRYRPDVRLAVVFASIDNVISPLAVPVTVAVIVFDVDE
jgi:predicted Na+-dependent transporter